MSSNKDLKILFAGTPDFSATILKTLLDNGYKVEAAYCQPDRRVGRGKKLAFGPVKQLALENNIPVEQPVKFNLESPDGEPIPLQKLKSYQADLMIVVAYGLILPKEVLETPKFGCINIHASILPRWRGAAPIQRAIQQGDSETGITIMQMDEGLDTGNMLLKAECPITSSDTGSSLHDKLATLASKTIIDFLPSFSSEEGSSLSPGDIQDSSLATYAHKLTKKEAEIDWNLPAEQIERQIRAFNAWPVSYTFVGKNRLRIWQVELSKDQSASQRAGKVYSADKDGLKVVCGDGKLITIKHLQADGSRVMCVGELLNGKSHWFKGEPLLGQHNECQSSKL